MNTDESLSVFFFFSKVFLSENQHIISDFESSLLKGIETCKKSDDGINTETTRTGLWAGIYNILQPQFGIQLPVIYKPELRRLFQTLTDCPMRFEWIINK